MKTSKILLTSLLAAAAMSSVPAFGVTSTTTELDGVTYSGTIWTTDVSGVDSGTYLSAAGRTYTSGETSYAGNASVSGGKFYNYFFNENESVYVGNTLRLTGATADHTVYTDWKNYAWLGGLITDAGDYTYTIGRSGSNADTAFRLKGSAGVNMSINADTVILGNQSNDSGASGISVESDGSWVIASGKTLTLQSSASVTFAESTTTTVSGGGTLKISGALEVAGTLSNAATLDLSGSKVTLANAITNTGTVTVDSNTVFVLADTMGSDSVYTVISGSGTVSDGSTLTHMNFQHADGTTFTGRSTVDVATSGVVTVTEVAVADLVWNGGASGGTWGVQTTKNWLNGGSADEFYTGDNVTFNTSGDVAVTVASAGVTAGTMTVSAGTVALSGGKVTATSLNVETGAQLNVGNTVSATSLNVGTDAQLNIGNTTVSATSLSGAGTVQLSTLSGLSTTFATGTSGWTGAVVLKGIGTGTDFNPNNYGIAGSKVVFDGVGGSKFYFLVGPGDKGSGTRTFTPDIEIASGGLTLTDGYSSTVYAFTGAISGSGTWAFSHGSANQQYVFTGDVSGFSGTLNLANASQVTFGNGGTGVTGDGKSVSGTGTITMADTDAVLTYNYSNDVLASTTLAGGMSVVKQGVGSLTLTGTNTFSGGVTVSAGTLIAGSTSALGSGKTTVAAEAALGLIAGTTVTVNGGVELAEGAKIVVDMSAFTDKAETFALNLITTSALSYNGESITSDNVGTILGDAVTLSNWDKTGWTQSLSYADNTLSLTMTIPEPSTFGLLAGVGALALVAARRRRRAK